MAETVAKLSQEVIQLKESHSNQIQNLESCHVKEISEVKKKDWVIWYALTMLNLNSRFVFFFFDSVLCVKTLVYTSVVKEPITVLLSARWFIGDLNTKLFAPGKRIDPKIMFHLLQQLKMYLFKNVQNRDIQ